MIEGEEYMVVAPGMLLATSEKKGSGVYIYEKKTYSKYYGIVKKQSNYINVIPFNQRYTPKKGDKIIGKIKEFNYPFWIVDIMSPHNAYLHITNASSYNTRQEKLMEIYAPDVWIYSEIVEITDRVKLSMRTPDTKVLKNGRIAYIPPTKVPRLIGKNGSMIKTIQERTKCRLVVGQNGVIWITGDKTELVNLIIQKVDKEAHISGLTDRVNEIIDNYYKPNN
ncbi:MAG: RNA-binding protein [Candidatus Aenigmarchaeota archaeon ex4484_56]|nr:MAG: RNA-binding protein [Candidatus Aenigmarchaeota archaeon ex4484_56]